MMKKKKYPLLITSIICFVSAFVLFFLMTFLNMFLTLSFYSQEIGQSYFIVRRAIIPLFQIGIPILLIIASVVLLIISLVVEIFNEK